MNKMTQDHIIKRLRHRSTKFKHNIAPHINIIGEEKKVLNNTPKKENKIIISYTIRNIHSNQIYKIPKKTKKI